MKLEEASRVLTEAKDATEDPELREAMETALLLLDKATYDVFGLMLNCAVRYAFGRLTYVPGAVVDYITPLISNLSNRTLQAFHQDLTDGLYPASQLEDVYQKRLWDNFDAAVVGELDRRGQRLWNSSTGTTRTWPCKQNYKM